MVICTHTAESASAHLRYVIARFSVSIFLLTLLLILGRLIFTACFALAAVSEQSFSQWGDYLSVAVRFDIKVAGVFLIPAAALALLCPRQGLAHAYRFIFPTLNTLAFFLILTITVVNFFYFKTYDRIIDPFIFAPFKEDAAAVMDTVISDYPLISGTIVIVLLSAVYAWWSARLSRALEAHLRLPPWPWFLALVALVAAALYFICLRGSFTTFPIRQINAQVSADPLVNATVPNGPIALYWAWKWDHSHKDVPEISDEDLAAAFAAAGAPLEGRSPEEALEVRLPENSALKANPPHVVLALMESMSAHMLRFDDPDKRDLYGALRKYKDSEGYYFTRFVSEGNGTSDSITRLLTGVPDLDLSTSLYARNDFLLNSLKPFKEQGYHCVFITGGQGSWRSLDTFLRYQGFDEVLEMSSVRALFPQATAGPWGIDDEYVFATVLDYLRKHSDKPQLIWTLSITNHPPYRVPEGREPQQVELNEVMRQRFNFPEAPQIFATLRYANDQLGRLIDEIRADPKLAEHTLVAFTGDHNRRGNGYSGYPNEELIGYEVPFGIVDLSLAPTPAVGDSVARILEEMGLESVGTHGTTAALALLNDAVKKGGVMASSHVGGLSGAFIPVSEDAGMIRAAQSGALCLDKLEAMTCVCSVGLDMIAIPGDTSAAAISGIIADEAAIGMINHKTTAVRVIPAVGKRAGDTVNFGGLLGHAPVMPVNPFDNEAFIARGGRIPAPLHSLRN